MPENRRPWSRCAWHSHSCRRQRPRRTRRFNRARLLLCARSTAGFRRHACGRTCRGRHSDHTDSASRARHGRYIDCWSRSGQLAASARGAVGDDSPPSPGWRGLLVGSDAGWRFTCFDNLWRELVELVLCGLSPVEAIHGATGAAAAAIRRADDFGTLRPGLSADLLLVGGDAAHDVSCLADMRAVFFQGRRVTRDRGAGRRAILSGQRICTSVK